MDPSESVGSVIERPWDDDFCCGQLWSPMKDNRHFFLFAVESRRRCLRMNGKIRRENSIWKIILYNDDAINDEIVPY